MPAQVSYPAGNDYPESMGTHKHTYVLPLEPLAANTIYKVEATYNRSQEPNMLSVFRTGSASNARNWDTRQQR